MKFSYFRIIILIENSNQSLFWRFGWGWSVGQSVKISFSSSVWLLNTRTLLAITGLQTHRPWVSLSIFSNCSRFLGLRFNFFPNSVLSSLLRMVFNLSGVKRVWCANRSPTLINSNNEFSLLSWQIRCEAFPFKCFLPHFLPQLLKVERMNGYAPSTLAFLFFCQSYTYIPPKQS